MTTTLELPAILNLPDKMMPLIENFNDYRYWLFEGGRGGGKSQGIGRWMLYLGEQKQLRIVCGREIQKSIEESVYTILRDLIREFNLNWEVQASKLIHRKTGSVIQFKGFREQGSVNIKGLEGVDILWIDEAQAITKHTLDIIIPTIRKEKAKIIFSMNRYLKSDPVFKVFSAREDCKHVKINFDDNPFCSEALRHEASLCLEKAPDDYGHIWLGEPLEEADNFLFNEETLENCEQTDFLGCGHHEIAMGVDIARYGDDKCVATILQRRGPLKFEIKHIERWGKKNLMETTGRIVDLMSRFKPDSTAVDADGMVGVCDRLMELNYHVHEFHGGYRGPNHVDKPHVYANVKTEWFCKLKDLIDQGYLGTVPRETIDSLITVMYTHKSSGVRVIMSKEHMRSQGFKSPDEADSLMMAYWATKFLAAGRAEEQEGFRTPRWMQRKRPRQEANLFKIAGYR